MMDRSTVTIVAGVDEAGRGPLAGPVIAAAVILDMHRPIEGLADSKLLTAAKREELYFLIYERAKAVAVGRAEVAEIDSMNILQASLLAMKRAVEALHVIPELALVDGRDALKLSFPSKPIIGGDKTVPAISAASIVAKVVRDQEMVALDACYPGYGFAKHKGYSTKEHVTALKRLGVSVIHRRSFSPVRELLSAEA